MSSVDDLELGFDVAGSAATLALAYFEAGVASSMKRDGTPVTEADTAVERLLRESLSAARPGDSLLGEEFGRVGESQRVWILDPIDGTKYFANGDPNWRVHLALEVDGTTQLGLVVAPALKRCWWATRDGGAFESSWPRDATQTARLAVSTTSTFGDAVFNALDDDSRRRFPPDSALAPPSPLPLVELVRGEIDGFLAECCHAWDHAPWILIVEEAGGRFTDRRGGRSNDQGGGVYSNAAVHEQLVTWLGYPTMN